MATNIDNNRTLQNKAVLGVFMMILGLALYPLSDAFIKHLMGIYPFAQTTFLRAITRLAPLMIAMFLQGGPQKILKTNHVSSHIIRLGVNLLYTLSFLWATKMGTLTVIYSLGYTSSLFMIILSAIILKERVSWDRWVAVAIGMIGVAIAVRPGFSMVQTVALLVLFGTFLGSLNKILMRRLASTEHSLTIAIYPNIMMCLVMLPFLFSVWQAMPIEHWLLFGFVGAITALGQYCIAQALRYAQGSVLAPIDYSTFFWVVALDFFWWSKIPDLYTLTGALVIVGSNLYIIHRARVESAKKAAALVQG